MRGLARRRGGAAPPTVLGGLLDFVCRTDPFGHIDPLGHIGAGGGLPSAGALRAALAAVLGGGDRSAGAWRVALAAALIGLLGCVGFAGRDGRAVAPDDRGLS